MPHLALPYSKAPTLYYDIRGDGEPLVLLNGMSQSTANWTTQAKYLAETYRVIVYDARGQGRSALGPVPLTLGAHVDDLLHLLDHLDIEEATLCGFSHGARVAMATAAEHPARVDRLVLTSIGTSDDALRQAIVRSWREVLRLGGLEAMAWCVLPDILGERFLERNQGMIEAIIRATLQRNTQEGLQALLDGLISYPPPEDEAGRVMCPTLLITSDGDLLVSSRAARGLADRIGGTRHVRLAGCGHTIPIEEPDLWRAAVLDFMRGS